MTVTATHYYSVSFPMYPAIVDGSIITTLIWWLFLLEYIVPVLSINGMKMFISMKWKNCVCIVSNNLTRSGVLHIIFVITYSYNLYAGRGNFALSKNAYWYEKKCTKNNIQRKKFVEENWFLTYWPQFLEWCVVSSIDCLNFNRFSKRNTIKTLFNLCKSKIGIFRMVLLSSQSYVLKNSWIVWILNYVL